MRTWLPLLAAQLRRLGVDSVPIALFIAVFTGIVLSLLSKYIFTGAVPLYFVGALVGKTIMMELGPVLTGLALAGRVGANIAAEIGTMRVTEQVDALETLAYNPKSYLVVPRVLAGGIMFPVVTALAVAVGVTAGWLTAINLLDLSTRIREGPPTLLPLEGHLVRPDKGSELRHRRHPCRQPHGPFHPRAGQRASAATRPAPSSWVVRRSWCWTRSGRWCFCERRTGRSGRTGRTNARHNRRRSRRSDLVRPVRPVRPDRCA